MDQEWGLSGEDEKLLREAFHKLAVEEDVELDADLLLGMVEEQKPEGPEVLHAVIEEFLGIDQNPVDTSIVMDALANIGFVASVLSFFLSLKPVRIGDRCFARVKDEWYRGTVEEEGTVYVVALDDFVGRFRVKREDLSMDWELGEIGQPDGTCELCERVSRLTAHHLRPKEVHAKYLKLGFTRQELAQCTMVCRPCHSAVHRSASNDELAKSWYTIELLRTNTDVMRFVEWVRKTPVKALHAL